MNGEINKNKSVTSWGHSMRLETALADNGDQYPVVVDADMRIIPEILMFANFLSGTKQASPNTVVTYLRDLSLFFEWLHTEQLAFWEVKAADIPRFMVFADHQGRGPKAPATINRILATLSAFYRFFEAMGGYVAESPVVKMPGYAPPDRGRKFLHHTINRRVVDVHYFKRKVHKTVDHKRLYPHQAERFYDCIADPENASSLAIRNQLTFKILYETGMRLGELLHLQVNDMDAPSPRKASGNIYLIERPEKDPARQLKTGERIIPVSMNLLFEMDRYLTEYRADKDQVKYLMVSHKGPTRGDPLTANQVEKFFRTTSTRSGIPCTPHSLRHTHASNLADAGYDPLFIKARLGHANINTSAKYVRPSLDAQIASYEAYLAQKRGVLK